MLRWMRTWLHWIELISTEISHFFVIRHCCQWHNLMAKMRKFVICFVFTCNSSAVNFGAISFDQQSLEITHGLCVISAVTTLYSPYSYAHHIMLVSKISIQCTTSMAMRFLRSPCNAGSMGNFRSDERYVCERIVESQLHTHNLFLFTSRDIAHFWQNSFKRWPSIGSRAERETESMRVSQRIRYLLRSIQLALCDLFHYYWTISRMWSGVEWKMKNNFLLSPSASVPLMMRVLLSPIITQFHRLIEFNLKSLFHSDSLHIYCVCFKKTESSAKCNVVMHFISWRLEGLMYELYSLNVWYLSYRDACFMSSSKVMKIDVIEHRLQHTPIALNIMIQHYFIFNIWSCQRWS